MITHVVILAQGTQRRMGDSISVPKQLLQLPACKNVQILARTLEQLRNLVPFASIAIVSWHEVFRDLKWMGYADHVSLADPGNSSLKGIARYLQRKAKADLDSNPNPDRTVVLLGDVIYSWACLEKLFDVHDPSNKLFVCSGNMSKSAGELWGLRWDRSADQIMMAALELALTKHPPFSEYQPGQMRRWLYALDDQVGQFEDKYSFFAKCDDYTRDVDEPKDLPKLGAVSELAKADDEAHGVRW